MRGRGTGHHPYVTKISKSGTTERSPARTFAFPALRVKILMRGWPLLHFPESFSQQHVSGRPSLTPCKIDALWSLVDNSREPGWRRTAQLDGSSAVVSPKPFLQAGIFVPVAMQRRGKGTMQWTLLHDPGRRALSLLCSSISPVPDSGLLCTRPAVKGSVFAYRWFSSRMFAAPCSKKHKNL